MYPLCFGNTTILDTIALFTYPEFEGYRIGIGAFV